MFAIKNHRLVFSILAFAVFTRLTWIVSISYWLKCSTEFDPVCWNDGTTYTNECMMMEYVEEAWTWRNVIGVAYTWECTEKKDEMMQCESYFDWCNTCTVNEDGTLWACTKMFCEENEKPHCIKKKEWTVEEKTDLTQCMSYFDWCNTCTVNEDGTLGACTEKFCMEKEEPKCLEKIESDQEPTMCTMQYAPVCASVAVQCIKAPCPAQQQTFGNECMMNNNSLATKLYEWACGTTLSENVQKKLTTSRSRLETKIKNMNKTQRLQLLQKLEKTINTKMSDLYDDESAKKSIYYFFLNKVQEELS